MARLQTITCDQCKRVKGESNHWFEARKSSVGPPFFIVVRGDEYITNIPDGVRFDLCGYECVTLKLAEFMAAKTIQPKGISE